MAQLKLPEINKLMMAGRLTDEPDFSFIPNGTAKISFRLASNRRMKKDDEWQTDTAFITVTAWAKLAEACNDYLHKGSAVYVEGTLRSRMWEKASGDSQMLYELSAQIIQFLDRKEDATGNEEGNEG